MVVSILLLSYFLLWLPCLVFVFLSSALSSLVYGLRGVDTFTVYGGFLCFHSGVQGDNECKDSSRLLYMRE